MEDDSPWATPAPASPVITRAASDGEAAGVWGATATATEHEDPTRRSRGKNTDEAERGTAESNQGSESLALDQTEHHLGPRSTGLSLGEDAEAWGTEESGDDATRPPASLPGPPAAAPPSPSPPASPSAPESADFTSQSPAGDSSADVQADQPVVVQGAPGTDGDGNEAEDDFEFDAPASAPAAGGDAADDFDDFGDFGDFDDAPVTGGSGGFEDADLDVGQGPAGSFDETDGAQTFVEEPSVMPIQPLRLSPLPSRADLLAQLEALVERALFPEQSGSAPTLTDEPVRQVEGLAQLLQSESSRETYAQLTTPPVFKPLDWTRSRARREHLIALGIPVNLDEVESHGLKPLPPLRITTPRSATHPHRTQSLDAHGASNGNAHAGPSRARVSSSHERNGTAGGGSGDGGRRTPRDERSLGPKPAWDRGKSERLLEYREDQLSLVPPKYLQRMQEDLVEACSAASSQLAWLRQVDEVRRDESKRKNAAIGDLIAHAQRLKASEAAQSGGGGLFRKGSQKRGASGSGPGGATTPYRTGSPVVR